MRPKDIDIEITDISNGFRAYSQKFVEHLLLLDLSDAPSYAFNAAVAFESEGFVVHEFPMSYIGGKSGMTFVELVKAWEWRSNYKKSRPPIEPTLEEVVAFLRLQYGKDNVDDYCRRRRDG